MNDVALGILIEAYIPHGVHEIECPRCIHRCHLVDDCVYCGGHWMIPLSRISSKWLEREFHAAQAGDRPEWMTNGLYHMYDECSGESDRWLVCEYGIHWISPERYYGAVRRRRERREESAVVKFVKSIFGGGK